MFVFLPADSFLIQKSIIELVFTSVENSQWTKVDSIRVVNQSQGCDTILYWPDTVLVLDGSVGINENFNTQSEFGLITCYPNPVKDYTIIKINISYESVVDITICDNYGRVLINENKSLSAGVHYYKFIPGDSGIFYFNLQFNNISESIKIISISTRSDQKSLISYLGSDYVLTVSKLKKLSNQNFIFNTGDTLLLIAYNDTLESGLLDAPDSSKLYTFQFTFNIPCPGIPTVEYEGQIYNTVQIFNQCWLKENLNAGVMIPGATNMQDNEILEKYCYDDDTNNCTVYGGLYQWNEMMNYRNDPGTQGICPEGWHIPTDDEWKILEGSVDSYYGIGDPVWDIFLTFRGADAGDNLKSESGWSINTGTDLFGFSALPGGDRYTDGNFYVINHGGFFWTSSINKDYLIYSWDRGISYLGPKIERTGNNLKSKGFSVRCIRDQIN